MQAAADIIQRIADDRLRRQGSEKFAAVGFGQDAVIQYDQRAPIGIGADQASAALAEFEHGLGQAVMREAVFALPLQMLQLGAGDSAGGRQEGQLDDDHGGQSCALDVDAFPKAGGAQHDRALVAGEALDDAGAAAVLTMGQNVVFTERGIALEGEINFVEHGVGGEEHQHAAGDGGDEFFQIVYDHLAVGSFVDLGIVGIIGGDGDQ